MTTLDSENKKCTLCGKQSEHTIVRSTNTFGSPDLDTRQAEMIRSTIEFWMQTCPGCGYCAPDIAKKNEKSKEIVSSDPYQKRLHNLDFPLKAHLANAFLCYSLIQENDRDYAGAAWTCVQAAWVCDDASFDAGAQECRKKAIALFHKAKENNQIFAEQKGGEEILLSDLLRRTGQFEQALKVCDDALKKKTENIISDILKFEKLLIEKKDAACHTVEEAIKRK